MVNANNGPGTRIIERGDVPTLVLKRARISVQRAGVQAEGVDLDKLSVVIGSGAECDLVLTDPTVSTRHFECVRKEDGCLLRDLASTNGTMVDGYRTACCDLPRSVQFRG